MKKEIQIEVSVDEDKEITLVVYDDLEECFEEFCGCPIEELEEVVRYDADGNEEHCTAEDMMATFRKEGFWGFTNQEDTVCVWIDKHLPGLCSDGINTPHSTKKENTKRKDKIIGNLVQFFAHELGHMVEPKHKNCEKEEDKADVYGNIAMSAYALTTKLFKTV